MTIQLTFSIQLHADYHISAGHGKGAGLDSALHRDADGVPIIRGTIITGLLREGLRALAEETALGYSSTWQSEWKKLQQQQPGVGSRTAQPGDLLFGAPSQPKAWQISTARPARLSLPQIIADRELAAHAAAHVRVDPVTRRAEAHKLFFREEGDQRLEFHFTATCLRNNPTMRAQATLLLAAARMVTALGARRRRGQGDCTIHLIKVTGLDHEGMPSKPVQDELLNEFDAYWLHQKTASTQSESSFDVVISKVHGEQQRFYILLRTDEPLLMARRAAAGNQFEGLDSIPGYAIRGALAGRIANRHSLKQTSGAVYDTFVRLFYRDGVHCSPLYVAHLNKQGDALTATIPAPLDLFVSEQHPGKGSLQQSGHPVLSSRIAAQQDFKVDDVNGPLKIDPLKGFLAVRRDAPIVRAKKQGEMHVTIQPKTGRAQDRELFGYVALETGQYFVGELTCASKGDWDNLSTLADLPTPITSGVSTPITLRLGKAHRRGYGQVTATLIPIADDSPSLWAGLAIEERVTDPSAPITLTLVSDTIIPDAWGRIYQEFTPEWIKEVIGIDVKIDEVIGQSGAAHKLHFARSRIVDTFDNSIGLPRVRDLALVAGSAVTFVLTEQLPLADLQMQLKQLEAKGIGLRCNEGFGRVVFNHPVYTSACQAVRLGQIRLPAALQLENGVTTSLWTSEQEWRDVWSKTITDASELWRKLRALSSGKRGQFAGLVRELAGDTIADLDSYKVLLEKYGEAEMVLPGGLPGRQKPNFFRAEGKPMLDLLTNLLTLLHQQANGDNKRWLIGCRLLADALASVLDVEEDQ